MQKLRHAIARNPLAFVAVAAAMGIIVADAASSLFWKPWLLALAFGFGIWTWRNPATWRLMLASSLAFAFVHECRLEATRFHPLRGVLPAGQRVEVIASGHFTRAPMTIETLETETKHEARFTADQVEVPSRDRVIGGLTELRIKFKDATFIPTGGRYEIHGMLSLPAPAANPGLYNPQKGAERQGYVADLLAREITAAGPPSFSLRLWLLNIAERSRHWIEAALALGIENDDAPRTLIQTMALGTNETGSAKLQEPFRNSGTLHVFAVSGLHVSMLAWIGVMLLRPFGLGRNRMIMILIPMVIGYAFVTGWRPSAARAALMCCIMLGASLIDRRSRPINSLGGCALLLLGGDTQELFQAGFQLSFGVVWAITAGARLVAKPLDRFASFDPFFPPQLASPWQKFHLWARREVISIFAVSAVATAASFPIMLTEFHSVTPVGILANCVLVPLAFVSLFTLVLSLIAAGTGFGFGQLLLNNTNWLLVKWMTASAAWFATLPWANFSVPYGNVPKLAPVTMSVLAMPPGEAAQMLESGGQHWMLDVGGASHELFTVLPFLHHEGINSLDGVILSHADAEHVGALEDLIPRFHPPLIMTSLHEPWRLDSSITLMRKAFGGHALDSSIAVKLQAGDKVPIGQARIHILYPTATDLYNKADDRALVARIECGKMRVLWCNDAGFITEKHLLSRLSSKDLASHVMIRNQHASDLSALPEFLAAVKPRLIITSNAPAIAEQRMPEHLAPYCDEHGIRLFDQAETGMVKLEIWPDRLETKTWLSNATVSIFP